MRSGAVCVVTGANTGIGRHTALGLAESGAQVVLAARSRERTQPVIEEIADRAGRDAARFVHLDLASFASVRRAATEILDRSPAVDVLINNAGVGGARGQTEDGFEIHFGVNHLGHFLLTSLLLDRILDSAPARVITVSSNAHYRARGIDYDAVTRPTGSFSRVRAYAVSKLANVLFSCELGRRLEGRGVTALAVHPGTVATDIWRRVPFPFRPLIKRFMISVEEGARSVLHCATAPDLPEETCFYCDRCRPRAPSSLARDPALAAELWRRSEAWTGAPT
jgi:retinol dehydrogenase 12